MNQISRNVRYFHRWLSPTLRVLKKKKESLPYRPPDPRKTYVEWNYDAELYAFGKRLGENFNRDMLRQALTERSYLEHEEKKQKEVGMEPEIYLTNNEELAVKGHALMEGYIIKYLTSSLPKLPNYYIRKLKDYLMSEELLAHVSKHIGIDDIILVPDDTASGESLGRGLKAVIQALDNKSRSERLIRDLVVSQLCSYDLTKLTTPDKPLEELEKTLNSMNSSPPEYRLISQSGINTLLPVYHVGIYCDKQFVGRGFGESITVAKEMACCDVLWKLWGITRRKPFVMDLEQSKGINSFQPKQIDVTK